MKISELQKIRTEQNAKTIDKAIAYIQQLEAERDEEMTERMRLEEHLRLARLFLDNMKTEIRNEIIKGDHSDDDWREIGREIDALRKKLAYGKSEDAN